MNSVEQVTFSNGGNEGGGVSVKWALGRILNGIHGNLLYPVCECKVVRLCLVSSDRLVLVYV